MKKIFIMLSMLLFITSAFCAPRFAGSEDNKDYWLDEEEEVTYCCKKSSLPIEVLKGNLENIFKLIDKDYSDSDELNISELNEAAVDCYEIKLVKNMIDKGYNFVMFNLPYSYFEEEICAIAITDGERVYTYWIEG